METRSAEEDARVRVIGDYQYRLKDCLGHGSFAEVYRGQRNDGLPVAIKRIVRGKLKKKKAQRLLEQEIQILQAMDHPNIMMLYERIDTRDDICLVTEFCEGGDLSEYIEKHAPLEENLVADFTQQLNAALTYLRSRDVVHRDLKPHNVLLSKTPSGKIILKLADFGFARILGEDDLAATFCGSPLYMAPEVLDRDAYSAKAELWSLGVILFSCVTGHPPFRAQSLPALRAQIKNPHLKPDIPASTSTDLADLLLQLLQVDPEHRMTLAELARHPFVRRAAHGTDAQHQTRSSADLSAEAVPLPSSSHPGSDREGVDEAASGLATPTPSEGASATHASGAEPGLIRGSTDGSDATGLHASHSAHSSNNDYVILDEMSVNLGMINDAMAGNMYRSPSGVRRLGPFAFGSAPAAAQPPPSPSSITTLAEFQARVEQLVKPANVVIQLARTRCPLEELDASTESASSSHAGDLRPGQSHCEAFLLLRKAMNIFRTGMRSLRFAVQDHPEWLRDARVKTQMEILVDSFRFCLRETERLQALNVGALLAQLPSVPSAEQLLYEYAIHLCREAVEADKRGRYRSSSNDYREALIYFRIVLDSAPIEDQPVIQRYIARTEQLLAKVYAKQDGVEDMAPTSGSGAGPEHLLQDAVAGDEDETAALARRGMFEGGPSDELTEQLRGLSPFQSPVQGLTRQDMQRIALQQHPHGFMTSNSPPLSGSGLSPPRLGYDMGYDPSMGYDMPLDWQGHSPPQATVGWPMLEGAAAVAAGTRMSPPMAADFALEKCPMCHAPFGPEQRFCSQCGAQRR
ncbi:uncharacterized protein MONBRDRAFT_34023 [Monosiga brevicollis MX1]|uniref:Protein kinase domain-containing protein n=1 Tax=Monosiga brevicollis TaxID=81824 RepID=A9V965_MONBE|nr:uncharacterized protein MONBRDRAFT_34023 [Monosiga brevicollis MX1]EDQ86072.1 predicted protein [Monosiga brevicollis MX1]|eukprot:XP_001749266.1 hypothetical protein [Monosiga brevicollis MX1]